MSGKTKQTSEIVDRVSGDGETVQLWTRRPVCGVRTTVVDRLGRLRSTGAIEEFEVQTWPDEIVLEEGNQRIPRLVEHLEQWADDASVSLRPAFEQRTVSPLIGESREVLTLPMLALIVYDDGLAGVYPCSDGERTWTVPEALDAFEDGVHIWE